MRFSQDPFVGGAHERLPIVDLLNEISGEVFEEEIPVADEHEHEDSQSLQSGRETPGSQSTNVVEEADSAYEPPAVPLAPRKRQAPPPPGMSSSVESAAEMNFVHDAEQILSDLDADLDQLYDQFPSTETAPAEVANVSISTSLHQSPQREAVVATTPVKVVNGTTPVVQDIIPPATVEDDEPPARQTVVLSVNTELDAEAAERHEVSTAYAL